MKHALYILFLLLSIPSCYPQGDLSVVPRRVVFENGNKRSETLYLTNRGKDTATYNLLYVNYKVDNSGVFKRVPEDSIENPSSKNFRFFPRRVTLAPNQTQTVKLQMRNFSELEDGEYRSHLLFKGVPRNNARSNVLEVDNEAAMGVSLKAVYGLTIPNIIRKGAYNTTVAIEDVSLPFTENNKRALSFKVTKSGNMSIYGSISIDYLYGDGSIENIGEIPGIAIYAKNDHRVVNMLMPDEFSNLSEGNIQITLTSKEERNINDIIAEYVIKL
ncbi:MULTISPECIES: hypothetical protein [Croceibacter]|uniref:hypothetical protein n=1 Tax=Croceibacter TaxID=216431 RepID=UPI000C3A9F2D|nr:MULTISPECIES: hypothetical protein [Croceibacter]MBG26123.1 hypothetical protein [Croceibacter sp.]|tara:strand:+ start:669 stop:1487 length:819 start_codon:yes stop_codon:yes gene_type:complete